LSAAQHVGRVPLALAVAPWRCLACLAVATWQHIASPRALAYGAEAEHVIVGVWHATRGVEAHPTPTTRMTTERNGGFYQGRTAPHRTCCHAQRNVAQQRVCLRLQGMTQVNKASKTWTRSRMRCAQAYSTWHIADECPQWCHTPHSAGEAHHHGGAIHRNHTCVVSAGRADNASSFATTSNAGAARNGVTAQTELEATRSRNLAPGTSQPHVHTMMALGTFSRQPKNSTLLAGKSFTGGATRERTWRTILLFARALLCLRQSITNWNHGYRYR